jgi:TolB protein
VELVRDGAAPASRALGAGAPYYFSWSPSGEQMVWQRNNERIDLYTVAADDVERLPALPGLFGAPAWSPVDDRLLLGVRAGAATDIAIVNHDEVETIVAGLEGPIAFAWSPDGNLIAYVDSTRALSVVDAVTGQAAATANEEVIAFFWSPDGTRLAYLTLAVSEGSFSAKPMRQQNAPALAWSVLEVASGRVQRFGSFVPTRAFVYLLNFFDQFGQSHRLWSPDSRYLLYAEMVSGISPVISVIDTANLSSAPLVVAEGSIGVWSYSP